MKQTVYVCSVGIAAPGLPDWATAQAVLRGEAPYIGTELPPYQPLLLPPNERRRAPPAVRQAFRAAEDAVARSPRPAAELATVFASSEADMGIIHRICTALNQSTRVISPTDFHNTVHNAAAGYWSIAVGARGPSNTLCGHDVTLAVALLETAAQVTTDGYDVLLVLYDVPPPPPLYQERPISSSSSVALVLTRQREPGCLGELSLDVVPHVPHSTVADAALEALRLSNPATRILPLLQLLAGGNPGTVHVEHGDGQALRIQLSP
ncbi:MAG: beta-ketoacyl synthase chain length factor [Nevskiales bacterium]